MNAVTADLGGGADQLASLDLLKGLDQLDAGTIDEDTFNQRYGHRGPHEFEISRPRSGEDPAGWRASGRSEARDRRGAHGEATEAGADPGARLDPARPPVPAAGLAGRRQVQQWGRIAATRARPQRGRSATSGCCGPSSLRAGELTGARRRRLLPRPRRDPGRCWAATPLDADGDRPPRAALRRRTRRCPPLPGADPSAGSTPCRWAGGSRRPANRRSSTTARWSPDRAGERHRCAGFPGSAGVVEGTARVILAAADGDAAAAG